MPRIFVCSPLRGDGTPEAYARNMELARGYCRDVLSVGAIPVAGHLFYPQFIDDTKPDERALGIALGQADMATCHELWFWFGDGDEPSSGMQSDMENACRLGLSIFPGAQRVAELRKEIIHVAGPHAPAIPIRPERVRVTAVQARALRDVYKKAVRA